MPSPPPKKRCQSFRRSQQRLPGSRSALAPPLSASSTSSPTRKADKHTGVPERHSGKSPNLSKIHLSSRRLTWLRPNFLGRAASSHKHLGEPFGAPLVRNA